MISIEFISLRDYSCYTIVYFAFASKTPFSFWSQLQYNYQSVFMYIAHVILVYKIMILGFNMTY